LEFLTRTCHGINRQVVLKKELLDGKPGYKAGSSVMEGQVTRQENEDTGTTLISPSSSSSSSSVFRIRPPKPFQFRIKQGNVNCVQESL
jgi:hypothetical protein